jgi:hypothetical protein
VGTSCEAVRGSWAIRSTARDMTAFLAAHLAALNPNAGAADTTLAEAIRLAQQPRRPTDLPAYAIGLGWRVQLATGTRVKTGSGDGFESVRSGFICARKYRKLAFYCRPRFFLCVSQP